MIKTFFKNLTIFFSIYLITFAPVLAEINNNTLPTNPNITSGSATINQTSNSLTINQTTNKLITNWSSFNIGKDASVEFIQPSSSSTALNRVNSNDPSYIYGSLKANGKLILINPSGVLFQGGSKVDVGAIIASSLNLKDGDFLNDQYIFEKDGLAGTVNNSGTINAFKGGAVALLSDQVTNDGEINTPEGTTALLSGEKITLTLNGNKLIKYTIDTGTLNSLVENKQAINAGDGIIILSAKGLSDVSQSVVKNTGTLKAESISKQGGKIYLSAREGEVVNSGTISTNSTEDKGGNIEITGDEITIEENSKLTATGKTGGGQILVGGSWQNSDSSVYQSTITTVETDTLIDASATLNGDGGEIVIWSDITNKNSITTVNGTLYAKGGSQGGDGGRIETSGATIDSLFANVSTIASKGKTGLWLIDPYDYVIGATEAGAITTALNSNNLTITTTNDVTAYGSNGNNASSGDITISSSIYSFATNQLSLVAANDININSDIFLNGNFSAQASNAININADILNNGTQTYTGPVNILSNIILDTTYGVSSSTYTSYNSTLTDAGSFSGAVRVQVKGAAGGTGGRDSENGLADGPAGDYTATYYLSSAQNLYVAVGDNGTNGLDSRSGIGGGAGGANVLGFSGGAGGAAGSVGTSGGGGGGGAASVVRIGTGANYIVGGGAGGGAGGNNEGGDGETTGQTYNSGNVNGTNFSGAVGQSANAAAGGDVDGGGSGGGGGGYYGGSGGLGVTGGDEVAGRGGYGGGSGSVSLTAYAEINTTYATSAGADGYVKIDQLASGVNGGNHITFSSTINGANSLTIEPGVNGDVTFNGVTGGTTPLTELTVGTTSSTGDVILSGDVNTSGAITIYGGAISLNENITTSTASNISLYAKNNINTDSTGVTIETAGGDILLNSNTDGNGGAINLDRATVESNGGDISLVGGSDGSGFAQGISTDEISGLSTQTKLKGIFLNGTYLDATGSSAGGDILLRGKGWQGVANTTNSLFPIGIDIVSYNNDGNTRGSEIITNNSGTINLNGIGGNQNNDTAHNVGINFFSNSGTANTISSGSGNIDISATAGNTTSSSLRAALNLDGGTASIYSNSGNINLEGIAGSSDDIGMRSAATMNIGWDGTNAGTSGDITLTTDSIASSSFINVNGTGVLTVEPYDDDFDSSLSWPISNVTTANITGLTIGKASSADGTSDVDVTIGSSVSVNGPITIYGDDITLNAAMSAASGLSTLTGKLAGASNFTQTTGTLTVSATGNSLYSGVISGGGNFTKTGSGTLTLSGTNTYSGNTTISAGGLTVSGQLGSGSYAGTIANSGTLTISSNSNQELSGVISGSGQIIKSGSGTLTLSGTNTFSTGTAATGQTDSTWGNIPNSDRTKNYSNAFASGIDSLPVIYDILNDVGGGNRDDFTTRLVSTSNSSFTYRIYRTDSGASLSSAWGAVDGVTYFNVFPVAISVNDGTLALTNNNAIANNNAIRVASNATLDVKGVTISNPIRLDQNSILTNSSSTASEISGAVIITNNSTINGTGNIELSGLVNLPIGISALGDVSLTKSGSNTLNLSGDNFEEANTDYSSYIGETILNAGTFSLGNVHSIGTLKSVKPKFTFSGGTLQFSSSNTTDISSIFSNSANQNYKIDTNGQSVTLASTLTSSGGTFEKKGTGTLTLSGNNTYDGNTTISAGTLKAGRVSSGTIGAPTAGPFGTGSLINNSTIDVDNKLIHNAKTTAGTIINKPSPTLSFTSTNLSASEGDNVSNTLTHSGNGTVAYSSSSNSIATVDPSSGAVTLVGNGTVTITASATSSNEYADASTTYSLVVTGFTANNSQQSQKASDNAVRNATNSIPKNNNKNTPTVNPTAGGGSIPGTQPLINFGGGFSGGGGANTGGSANTTAGTGQGAGGPGDGTGPGQGAGQGLGPQGGGSSGGGIINLGGGSSGGGGANTGGSANTTAGTGQGAGGPGDGNGPGQGAGQGLGPQGGGNNNQQANNSGSGSSGNNNSGSESGGSGANTGGGANQVAGTGQGAGGPGDGTGPGQGAGQGLGPQGGGNNNQQANNNQNGNNNTGGSGSGGGANTGGGSNQVAGTGQGAGGPGDGNGPGQGAGQGLGPQGNNNQQANNSGSGNNNNNQQANNSGGGSSGGGVSGFFKNLFGGGSGSGGTQQANNNTGGSTGGGGSNTGGGANQVAGTGQGAGGPGDGNGPGQGAGQGLGPQGNNNQQANNSGSGSGGNNNNQQANNNQGGGNNTGGSGGGANTGGGANQVAGTGQGAGGPGDGNGPGQGAGQGLGPQGNNNQQANNNNQGGGNNNNSGGGSGSGGGIAGFFKNLFGGGSGGGSGSGGTQQANNPQGGGNNNNSGGGSGSGGTQQANNPQGGSPSTPGNNNNNQQANNPQGGGGNNNTPTGPGNNNGNQQVNNNQGGGNNNNNNSGGGSGSGGGIAGFFKNLFGGGSGSGGTQQANNPQGGGGNNNAPTGPGGNQQASLPQGNNPQQGPGNNQGGGNNSTNLTSSNVQITSFTVNTDGSISVRKSNLNANVNVNAEGIIPSAQVVVLRPNQTPKIETGYEVQIANNEAKLRPLQNIDQDFVTPGDIVGSTQFQVEVTPGQAFNYTIEVRDGGVVIKPSDPQSIQFAEANRTLVIGSGILEAVNALNIPADQMKTIFLDYQS